MIREFLPYQLKFFLVSKMIDTQIGINRGIPSRYQLGLNRTPYNREDLPPPN